MIDFIEYVVTELKSKRLSKSDAAALVKQFSRRSSNSAATSVIHPLLQRNTSDLNEQRYSSTFTGEEFFLADHQVKTNGRAAQKVLPGVAYLEMARAAIEQALPEQAGSAFLELRNTVWAQPVVVSSVSEGKQVSIALTPNDDEQIDYEIYSQDADREIVHCQGRAMWSHEPVPARLDIEQIKAEMSQGALAPDSVYAACARMGLVYGPSFQGITTIHRGAGQVLAQLRLPSTVADSSKDYCLHPSLMDGALQAAVGLIESGSESIRPRLPYALETLRIVSPCTTAMVAWLRYAPGSEAAGSAVNVVKLDIDLCDESGNVCVQLRGFSWRLLSNEVGSLLATPVWQTSTLDVSANTRKRDFTEHNVILCELSQVKLETLEALVPQSKCLSLQSQQQKTLAQRYSDYALACFERIQALLQSKPSGRSLVQVVVADHQEQALSAGISGLLKTAALETPQFIGQLILVPAHTTAEELGRHLQAERNCGPDPLIKYEQGVRQVLRWQEVAAEPEKAPIRFKDGGVYLITGGLGGLGVLFAKEILAQTREARVVLSGRASLNAEKQALLDGLSTEAGRVSYRQVDLADLDQVKGFITSIKDEYHRINGILHSAGMIADSFILKKTSAEFSAVLAPKVTGTFNLDEASQDLTLDFFVLFSSIAGAMGNPGQADYAAANGFMDQFAAYRNRQVAAGQRHGRTLSIDWPLWQGGGMGIDPATEEMLQQTTGMQPMQTATGIEAFYGSLASPCDQMLVVEGDVAQIRRALLAGPAAPVEPEVKQPEAAIEIDSESLREKTQHYLRKQFSELLKVPAQKIDPRAALENYGIDSILAMKLTNQLETTFGSLPKTLFFEYQTIRDLSDYFIAHYPEQLTALLAPATNRNSEPAPVSGKPLPDGNAKPVPSRRASRRLSRKESAAPGRMPTTDDDPIAIIGLSGRYPEAINIEAYWDNLREGKDCITEVPTDRWNWREYFSDDRSKSGHHYSKWGGFIAGVDEFDPLFFNISPVDAEHMDPQERLFLQHVWMAVEDAGYTRASLQVPCEPSGRSSDDLPGQVGVYAGVMYTEYQLFGAEAIARGKRLGVPGNAASIANRVSYAFNLHGPSMTLDTMCSSSLTAIHLACEDLKHRRTILAIAGGVNVSIHPNKYLVLSEGQFISGDGHCQSFGEGGDGYIPGEGVGAVVLKRLSDAKRDGDHIYGIIRGSALTHGGKTNGYSVPNPQAQTSAIRRALAESRIDARHISYIEAHGTGTKLGDPIEIAALSKAFSQYTEDSGFCRIGSAKSNVGHCESAAGIAGLTKVLLQMQHQQIVPSLHSEQLNPYIDFDRSPFVVNQTLRAWEQPVVDGRKLPRIAGISSFGAGGSNAHMIVEEYQAPARQPMPFANVVVVLSARTPAQLQQKASELLDFVRPRLNTIDLVAMAYTLQVGREAMEERLGLVVNSAEQLVERLAAYVAGEQGIDDAYQGQVKRNNETLSLFSTDADLQQAIEKWIASRKLSKLLDLWVKGLELDWSKLYGEARPQRLSLPTYPFARERYWIDVSGAQADAKGASATAAPVLHPLLHSNTSDLSEQRYCSTFTGDEFFLADHQVNANGHAGQKVLPAVAYLEMARAAIEQSLPARPESMALELRNTVWAEPVIVTPGGESKQVRIALSANGDEQIDYEIYSQDGDQEVVHCQGLAVLSRQTASPRLEIEQLKQEMGQGELAPDTVYAACERMGLVYGPAFQGITAIHRGTGQVLAQLRLPKSAAVNSEDYVLHPSLMDGALQACVGLIESGSESTPTRLPYALETLRIVSRCTPEMVAWVRYARGSQEAGSVANVVKVDIDLCDASGNVCVQMHGLSSRLLSDEAGNVMATPVWQASDAEVSAAPHKCEFAEHHVILCELSKVNVETLESLVPQSRCLTLQKEPQKTIAQRYSDYALACFERIQAVFQSKPQGRALVQVVIPDHQEQRLLAGLSGLLKTAALENPQLTGQVILVRGGMKTEELGRRLDEEKSRGRDPLIKYEQGERQVLRWQEVAAELEKAPIAFKDDGVYLITGGLGGLGLLFAKEILDQTSTARVILTGRAPFTEQKQGSVEGLFSQAGRVSYRQLDLDDLDQVKRVIAAIREEHYRLDGILHSAGMIADNFILKKAKAEFSEVLAPKVTGTYNLDQASQDVELDFFVVFSSIAGALGNPGQADYAAANGFMDQFAAYRNRQVAAKERHGRTRSINWPLWQAGGMGIDPATQKLLQQTTGMQPMRTTTGMEAFYRSLTLRCDQTLVVEGDVARIRQALLAGPAAPADPGPRLEQPVAAIELDPTSLRENTQEYLRKELSQLLKLPSQKIDPQAALEQYGIDSILAMKLTNQLEKTFGSLSKTLFFEYQTICELADYFVAHYPAQLTALLAPGANRESEAVAASQPAPRKPVSGRRSRRRTAAAVALTSATREADPIAIIGLSGRYPEAVDLDAYWDNLREGKDCISEIPGERWNWREYFSDDRSKSGRHYSKWGGFIAGVDEFDPLFFNISPVDAELIDPQERLFLQHAWMAMEDAGYTRATLQVRHEQDLAGQVGVYAGVMYNEYQLFGVEAGARGRHLALPGSTASIANRVSYALNLHGPSVTLDTMCSSSLTAIHFACQDLKLGRTSLALAGGVNVSIHPNKYFVLSDGQFISGDGHCQSFGEGGDGYIPGEGVGVVVLKRLSDAKRDGDHIYGIIRGSTLNHGGKTNGYTVPNPQAQASAIARALAESHTDARHISYIEAHGTGTKLGDPIEIAALSKAFQRYTQDTEFCLIGSVKSNIGHCESAAGIAGLTKVLLQMQHQQIVPSLHSAQLNPHIDFAKSPFVVNRSLRTWEQPVIDGRKLARIAGISSFGAGGSNAHMIVEEYEPPVQPPAPFAKVAILLSARSAAQLQEKACRLLDFVRQRMNTIDLVAMAYTLQVGRESMEERLGFVVSSVEQLVERLTAYVGGEQGIDDAYQGQVKRNNEALSVFSADADLQQTIDKWIANRKFSKLLDLWVKGLELDWSKLYGDAKPQRLSLPAYPFARERYWVDTMSGAQAAAKGGPALAATVLHPLLHSNISDLSEQRYRSTFSGDEFFLADHQVKNSGGADQKVLPGVAYLEMARAAVEQALPALPESTVLELRNTVWAQPLVVSENKEVSITLSANDNEEIDYEIYSEDGDQQIVHCQGRAVLARQPAAARLDIQHVKGQMGQGLLGPESVYAACARMGLVYGPSFQGIAAIHRGTGQVLAQLRLPRTVAGNPGDYVLHPSLMDGALQACVGLIDDSSEREVQPRLPFALETLRVMSPCTAEMVAWVRYARGSQATDPVVKLDIDLCDASGNVCVQMHGLSSRLLSNKIGSLMATPVWQAVEASAVRHNIEFAEHRVIMCDSLQAETHKTIAQRYSDCALNCFEAIQAVLQGIQAKPQGKVLVQVVAADYQEEVLLAGLSGLLRTAALENPQFIGQLILAPAGTTAEELRRRLEEEKTCGFDPVVKYENGGRKVLRWQEVAAGAEEAPIAFKDDGVYLISGGLGGLGILFAKEILEQTRQARVVLTGRAALSAEKQALLDGWSTQANRVSYRQLDLGDLDQVRLLIDAIQGEGGRLKGIIHSAGMIADNFILRKTNAEFSDVLAPKVTGTYNLDQATCDVELDFFVLFSSIAGAMGNLGQADYATANGFMDQFAAYRNRQVAVKKRHGRTRSINWPLWQAGGMGIDAAAQELLQQTTGMQPMQTATGMEAFYRILASPYDQILIAEGETKQMRRALLTPPAASAEPQAEQQAQQTMVAASVDSESLREKTQDFLRREFSALLKLPFHKIDPQAALENYGIDSILAMKLTNQLEKTFGSLSKTLFFEYQTIAALAGYFVKAHGAVVQEKIGLPQREPEAKEKPRPTQPARIKNRFLSSTASARKEHPNEIAIVGLAGRYPEAENLMEFWRNLQSGRDCITEIPAERWDHQLYFDADPNKPGKSYSKWGGFIADVDKFDPLFFNISPKEAELIDPQERLFLETAWQTIEDAGYTKESISGSRVGVFVGVMWGQYELFGAESVLRGNTTLTGSSHASIANRVSYFFDFHGPSIALDTMCSSSLTAIHLACDELRKGDIDAAIAGGVNVSIHPYKYLSLSQGKFAASDGRCRSFGAGGDGYVPGEGVGAVLLKPLDKALRDGDQIYAVIKSSSVNHGGKTNGYSVPNPNAQGDLILDALKKAGIDPGTLSYVETHGTGTSLGDPIEITGLSKAFEGSSEAKQFCPIGSVKSNIGHLESAAGIAAVTKALLQIRHQQLVPSLHADPLNPNINFKDSPFYVQTELTEWKRPDSHPRRVGVSSFGAGGSNAHLILEEYAGAPSSESAPQSTPPEAFVLSAKDRNALCRYAERFVDFLGNASVVSNVSLANIAYTSQVGRTPMDARLVIIASSVEDLKDKLNHWVAGNAAELEGVFYGKVEDRQHSAENLIEGPAGKAFLEALLANRDLEKIARLWILGVGIDWSLLHRQSSPRRVSLPTYPFAKERCWINQESPTTRVVRESVPEKRRTYYYPEWTLKGLAAQEEKRPATEPTLILDTSTELFITMKQHLENASLALLKPGTSFEEVEPNVYAIDPEREEQFQELVENLKIRGRRPGAVIHHLCDVCNLAVPREVAQQLSTGPYSLLYLSKALMTEKHPAPLRIMSVFSTPLGSAISGFLKTLTLESPACAAKAIEVDGEMSLSDKCSLIRDELQDNNWTTQEIRYPQQDARYVRGLVPHPEPKRELAALPLKRNGVYVITGGLGGLGIIFGEYLATKFQSKLVLVGRSALSASQSQKLRQLEGYGSEVVFVQADVSRLEDMKMVVREAKARFSEINGVIHCAGVNRDAFILKKTKEEMDAVLEAKVYGTINLDLATSGENLDLFVLFSSVAGVLGNVGQSDYAYGNRFLDSFAESRESLRKGQQRQGRTMSIDWPLWEDGGMGVAADSIALLEERTGICPLPTADGLQYWEDFLRSAAAQGVALYGIPSKIAACISQPSVTTRRNMPAAPAAKHQESLDSASLFARTESYLKEVIGEEIKLASDRIGSSDPLESFGIDSVMINRINARLERDLGALPKTLLYEHETVRELATYLIQTAREALSALPALTAWTALSGHGGSIDEPAQPAVPVSAVQVNQDEVSPVEEIAIIGIHGYYPHSSNLDEYWDNLKQGKDLIDVVPSSRWDYEEFYHPDPAAAADGKIYCKWGGFVDDHDKFDARFFKISSAEAKLIDPQERLFLESVWAAIEDAGYTRDRLKSRFPKGGSADVGVFVGVTTNSYHLWAPEERSRGNFACPTALPWSIANRVSYFFDFNGPSLPVDTACSSSLVAIHLACESLRNRDCQVAVAGGVNLYLHPSKYQSLCQRRMLSLDGKCRSYGDGDDGFVPGEGVGTLVLKPLSKAIEDRDHVYAVVRASAFDHSGRSNGYSAPNPNAQAGLISRTLEKAQIHPETISYVEGHGTGTQLGDSIEIAALTQAFQKQTAKKHFCPIGSVKANIGHSESAAGIAGVAKVILQMQHRQLAPSIYSDAPNPNIEFDESPFYLQHGLSEWESPSAQPRRALINSFGAGGVNACVVVEEYEKPDTSSDGADRSDGADGQEASPHVFTLSAKDEERLREYANRLVVRLRDAQDIDLASLCYTLQVGREAMEERLAIVVSNRTELIDRLDAWSKRGSAGVYRGSVGRRGSKRSSKPAKAVIGEQGLSDLASRWAAGEEVDWESLYSGKAPRRMGLPTYPFARERYWVSDSVVAEMPAERPAASSPELHPLITHNSSTLKEVRFSSTLPDSAFYAVDHRVNEERVFPGAGLLEMALVSGNIASEQRVRNIKDVVWIHPVSFQTGAQTLQTVLRDAGDSVEYVISSFDDENETIVHSEGRLAFGSGWEDVSDAEDPMPLEALKAKCARAEDGAACYEKFREYGLYYGPSFQTIQELYVNGSFALSKLKIADHLKGDFGRFILHPSIIDGALQTVAGLIGNLAPRTPYLPFALDEIEIIRPLPQICYAYVECAETNARNYTGVTKFNIRLLSETGEVLIKLKNVYVRPLAKPLTTSTKSSSHSLVAAASGD